MELNITLTPVPAVKTRRLLAVGYIKYQNVSDYNDTDNGSVLSRLQVHGLLVIDEAETGSPLSPGVEEFYG